MKLTTFNVFKFVTTYDDWFLDRERVVHKKYSVFYYHGTAFPTAIYEEGTMETMYDQYLFDFLLFQIMVMFKPSPFRIRLKELKERTPNG